MTAFERQIYRDHTCVEKVHHSFTKGKPVHTARLVVDNQSFDVGYEGTKQEAEWMRKMLAVALAKLISRRTPR